MYTIQKDKPDVRPRKWAVTLGVREDRVKHDKWRDDLHQHPSGFSYASKNYGNLTLPVVCGRTWDIEHRDHGSLAHRVHVKTELDGRHLHGSSAMAPSWGSGSSALARIKNFHHESNSSQLLLTRGAMPAERRRSMVSCLD